MPFRTISGIAQEVTGSASGFRRILDFNPAEIPFTFPPTVQTGLDIARQANEALGLGLRVPSASDLEGLARGQVDLILKGVRGTVLDGLNEAQSSLLARLGDAEKVLNSIEWLL